MPVSPTYPGVYVQELRSGNRTIVGVATSVTAFVGAAWKGPENEATLVGSFGEFERYFGGLWERSPLTYAVHQYFQTGGKDALIVRVSHDGSAGVAAAAAAYVGASCDENLRLRIKSTVSVTSTSPPSATVVLDGTTTTRFRLELDGGATSTWHFVSMDEEDSGTSVSSADALYTGGPGSGTYTWIFIDDLKETLRDDDDAIALVVESPILRPVADAETFALTADAEWEVSIDHSGSDVSYTLSFAAISTGEWGNWVQITIDHEIGDDEDGSCFNLTVEEYDDTLATVRLETFRNVNLDPASARYLPHVIDAGSKLIALASFVDVDLTTLPTGSVRYPRPVAGQHELTGGTTGGTSAGALIDVGDIVGSQASFTGIYALEKADIFNLLCIPPPSFGDGDDIDQATWAIALVFCEDHRAVCLVDAPSSWTDGNRAYTRMPSLGLISEYGAVYFPRVRISDPLRENRLRAFVPCGVVAGVIARTDAQRGIWKAPSGLEARMNTVGELAVKLTDNQHGLLNPLGLNCLRTFPSAGTVVWGARTLAGADRNASDWKYLPVRRVALYIEESLYRGLQWAVFEPNDEPLWGQIRLSAGTFMHQLFRQGAFKGAKPADAYFVKCDAETTTQADIDRGVVNVIVGFAPLKPAEFVIISIQQIAGQDTA